VSAFAAFCGALVGLGIVLVLAGWRANEVRAPRLRRTWTRHTIERRTLRLAYAAGAGVLVGIVTGWPVAALLAVGAGWGAPVLLAGTKGRAEGIARIEAIAGWAEMLRDTMAGAAGLEQAIVATATVAPLPIRPSVANLAARLQSQRLAPALRVFADEVADPTMDLVVAALVLAAEHQAQRLGELLGSLATAARDQATMRLRVEAGQARARASVKVVVGATVGLALGLAVLDRGYLAPYGSTLGQLMLLIVGGLFGASFLWLNSMSRPSTPERFLASNDSAFDGEVPR
jgi:Flp pilus assembly protein TadB